MSGIPAFVYNDLERALGFFGEILSYTPRGGTPFDVLAAPHNPSPQELTAGMQVSQQIVAFSARQFRAASGGIDPKRGDTIHFGGKERNVEEVSLHRRGGIDYRFNVVVGG